MSKIKFLTLLFAMFAITTMATAQTNHKQKNQNKQWK